jgi:MOSC domain-containing protein YiiM
MSLESLSRAAVVHVQVGKLEDRIEPDGSIWTTAIYKKSVTTPIDVINTGLVGDEHTGGGYDVDRAICCQSLAHYRFWRSYFRRDFPLGTFGENIILDGFLDEDVCIGDVIRCGTALMQVTQSRTPCSKQAKKIGEPNFVKLIEQTQRRGFLLRVLEPGTLCVGDTFELIERPHPEAPMLYVNRMYFEKKDREAMQFLADLEPLAHDWRSDAAAYLARLSVGEGAK